MNNSLASISGLASGIQWRDLIDQMVALETAPIDRLQQRVDTARLRTAAWADFTLRVSALRDAAARAAGNPLRAMRATISGRGLPERHRCTPQPGIARRRPRHLGIRALDTGRASPHRRQHRHRRARHRVAGRSRRHAPADGPAR
jgi:hypothetical protein